MRKYHKPSPPESAVKYSKFGSLSAKYETLNTSGPVHSLVPSTQVKAATSASASAYFNVELG